LQKYKHKKIKIWKQQNKNTSICFKKDEKTLCNQKVKPQNYCALFSPAASPQKIQLIKYIKTAKK
jgi:hypothetical protein